MPLEQPRKPIKNILSSWATYSEYGDVRIRGKVLVDQPDAHVHRGDWMITTAIVRIYKEHGQRFLETKNSRYILSDED